MRAAVLKPIIRTAALAVFFIAAAGCAGTPLWPYREVLFQSKPEGAVVSISDGQSCVTPCTLKLAERLPRAVMFEHKGCEGGLVPTKVTLNPNGTLTVVDYLKNQTVTYRAGEWWAKFRCPEKAT
ncbi:MAG: hypothetical protein ACREB6_06455 [Rhodospirillales bacterium]